MGEKIGAYSITFHAAFYMKQSIDEVYKTVYKSKSFHKLAFPPLTYIIYYIPP